MTFAYTEFLDNIYAELSTLGIDSAAFKIDHLAYKTASNESFKELLKSFSEIGTQVHDNYVGEYRVAIFELNEPFYYHDQTIGAIELLTAAKYAGTPDGWDHAEFLVPESYLSLIEKYPHISWNTDAKDRSEFPMITLTLPSGVRIKFPKEPVLRAVTLNS